MGEKATFNFGKCKVLALKEPDGLLLCAKHMARAMRYADIPTLKVDGEVHSSLYYISAKHKRFENGVAYLDLYGAHQWIRLILSLKMIRHRVEKQYFYDEFCRVFGAFTPTEENKPEQLSISELNGVEDLKKTVARQEARISELTYKNDELRGMLDEAQKKVKDYSKMVDEWQQKINECGKLKEKLGKKSDLVDMLVAQLFKEA